MFYCYSGFKKLLTGILAASLLCTGAPAALADEIHHGRRILNLRPWRRGNGPWFGFTGVG